MKFFSAYFLLFFCVACRNGPSGGKTESIMADGHAVSMAKDNNGGLHVAYCEGDSILYTFSEDGGRSFSNAGLVTVLPGLAATHWRGPQVAVSGQTVSIIACNKSGDIFSYRKNGSSWQKAARVNDQDSAAREGLMSLGGDGNRLFAVWLDSRDKQTKIYGSASADGGAAWSKNILIYASPDSMVCSCCKPSVALNGNQVSVMFRNLINGCRDLYLTQSADGGKTFNEAEKLGTGSWPLNGCPMDGGGLAINENGKLQTVWRREDKIFSCEPGHPEKQIGEGSSCGLAAAGKGNVYVWTEKGNVMCMLPADKEQILGKGRFPVVKAVSDKQVVCVWENEKHLQAAVISL